MVYGIHGINHEVYLEMVIESLPKWDLNPKPLNSVQML